MLSERPSVVLLPSPNNPTGTALPLEAVDGAVRGGRRRAWSWSTRRTPSSAAPGTPSALELLPRHRNLVVTRTMSKAFALAGRAARATSPPTRRSATRSAWSGCRTTSSAVTQAVALAALRHADELLGRVDDLRAERDATVGVAARARASRSPRATPTSCCSGGSRDRHAVWQGLLDRGVLVREVGPDGWLRVSIGTPDGDGSVQGRTDGAGHAAQAGRWRRTGMSRTARGRAARPSESKVLVEVDLDGTGRADVSTGVGFYDHMLTRSPGTRWST